MKVHLEELFVSATEEFLGVQATPASIEIKSNIQNPAQTCQNLNGKIYTIRLHKYNLLCFDNKLISWCFWYLVLFLLMLW